MKRIPAKNKKNKRILFAYFFLVLAVPLTVLAIIRFRQLNPDARGLSGLVKGNVRVIAEIDSKNNVNLVALKQPENANISNATKIDGPVLSTIDNTGKSTNFFPIKKRETYRFKHEFDSSKNLIESNSGNEKYTLYEYILDQSPNLRLKLNNQFNSTSLNNGLVKLDDILANDEDITIQANTVTKLYTNTENRTSDKTFDIFIVGLCYESDMAAYNRFADIMVSRITNGDYFKDNLYRINISKVNESFTRSYGCANSGSAGVKIANVVKALGADTVIVLVNNSDRTSWGYFPDAAYQNMGIAWMSRPITDLDQLVLHEMGHSIAALWDEYVYINDPNAYSTNGVTAQAGLSDFLNCKSTCSAFSSRYTSSGECSKGCSGSTSLYRTTKTSIMKNWSGVYNLISKDAIEHTINSYAPKNVAPPPPDPTSPTVNFSAPSNNSSITGTINITINASDNVGVTSLDILVDGKNVKSCGAVNTCMYSWDTKTVTNGSHSISAIAKDAANNFGTTGITVTVANSSTPPPPTSSGLTKLISPANGSNINSSITLSWENTNSAEYHIYIGKSVGGKEYYTKRFNGSTFSVTLNNSDLLSSISNNSKVYVRMWTNLGNLTNAGWGYNDYSFTYVDNNSTPTDKSVIELNANFYTNVANSYPKIRVYLNKTDTGKVIEVNQNRTYKVDLDRRLAKGDLVSLTFSNDTENNGTFTSDRNVIVSFIKIDGRTVYALNPTSTDKIEMVGFNTVYDRANKENGEVYFANQNWGNIPDGFWDNVGISNFSLNYFYWNGSINITLL